MESPQIHRKIHDLSHRSPLFGDTFIKVALDADFGSHRADIRGPSDQLVMNTHSLLVREDMRGLGYGKKLVSAMRSVAEELRVKEIHANIEAPEVVSICRSVYGEQALSFFYGDKIGDENKLTPEQAVAAAEQRQTEINDLKHLVVIIELGKAAIR